MDFLNIDDLLKEEEKPVEEIPIKKKITSGQVTLCVFIGIFFSILIFLLVGVLYTNYIRFPAQEVINEKHTGAYALSKFEENIHKQKSVSNDDFLLQEKAYANGDEVKLAFIEKVVNTVKYEPNIVNAKNVYGNDMIDRDTMGIITLKSPVVEGEEVNISYIDYNAISFNDKEKLQNLMISYDLTTSNVDYSNVLKMFL